MKNWYLFPVAIIISSIAMLSGVGGAIMFSPFFLLVLGLEPELALAIGLVIEVFGFSSGVLGYLKEGSVNFSVVRQLLGYSLLGTVPGILIGHMVDEIILKLLLLGLLLFLAYQFLIAGKKCSPLHLNCTGTDRRQKASKVTFSIKGLSLGGGLLLGMISSGLGEINSYREL